MKVFIVAVILPVLVYTRTDTEIWLEFKASYGKLYTNIKEDSYRFSVFQTNLRKIESHNAKYEKGETSYYLGVNKFADMTQEEFRSTLTLRKPNVEEATKFKTSENFVAPESLDWREQGAVLPVKDQGHCGSCWAFSTTGALEGQNAIKHGKKISLSEQDLVDCSYSYSNKGCNGGHMDRAFLYVRDNGIASEEDYPYTGEDGRCRNVSRTNISVNNVTILAQNETDIKDAVASIGPIALGVNADELALYAGGIFDDTSCYLIIDHGVLGVGYGTEDNKDYWIIKNSWGTSWGEDGYFRILRNQNICGIAQYASYASID